MEITLGGTESFRRFLSLAESFGEKALTEVARGLNDGGDVLRTQVIRSLSHQSGAKVRDVRKALKTRRAKGGAFVGPGGLQYEILSKGGFIPLMAFNARQTSRGVSAAPWGKRRIFPHSFIATMPSGHTGVFTRIRGAKMVGKNKQRIRELWGPALPRELIKGETAKAFEQGAERVVLPKIMTRLGNLLTAP